MTNENLKEINAPSALETDPLEKGELDEFADDLDEEYSAELIAAIAEKDQEQLTMNLEGFASCFPDWDLHPPVKK